MEEGEKAGWHAVSTFAGAALGLGFFPPLFKCPPAKLPVNVLLRQH